MTGHFFDSNELTRELAEQVSDADGCVDCGYAYAYADEGCDACAPIKALLSAAGRAHHDTNRS